MADLTADEIAELRKLYEGGEETALEWRAAVLAAHPFLLDEVERMRAVTAFGGACPHGGRHAPYCAGCCAQFDHSRMVLIHGKDCRFRGHERATD